MILLYLPEKKIYPLPFRLNGMVVALKETIAHSDEHINIKRKRQM
jgi:hypothetical protein